MSQEFAEGTPLSKEHKGGTIEGSKRANLAIKYETMFQQKLFSILRTECERLGIRTYRDIPGLTKPGNADYDISELLKQLEANPELSLPGRGAGDDEKNKVSYLLIGAMVDAAIRQEFEPRENSEGQS